MAGEPINGGLGMRAARRVPIHLSIETCPTEHPFVTLHWRSENLSTGGLCLKPLPGHPLPTTDGAYFVGKRLNMEFSLPGQEQKIRIQGRIRWLDLCLDESNRERMYNAGLSFENILPPDRLAVSQLITGLLRRPQSPPPMLQ